MFTYIWNDLIPTMTERARTTATILLAVCIVLSGCTGGVSEATHSTSARESTTHVAATSTSTTELRTTDTESELHPLVDGTVSEEHVAALRNAKNFTVRSNVTMHGTETDEMGFLNTTTIVDVSIGSALSRLSKHNLDSQVTYLAPDGERYQRIQYYEGQSPEYHRPSFGPTVNDYVRSSPKWFVEAYNYTYEGTTELEGESVHVYTVTSVDQLTNRSATYTRYNPANVTSLRIQMLVTDDGLVTQQRYRLVREDEEESVTLKMQINYTDLGQTEVEPPSWLDEAKQETEPRTTVADRRREVERTVRNEALGAAVTVTGPKFEIDHVEFDRQTGGIWDTGEGGYRKAQVSSLVELELPYSTDVTVTTLELSYNESTVPAGDEAGLDVYQYNRTLQTFVEVETTIDAEANVAYAEVQGEGTYLVMHTPTWREYLRS